MRLAEINFFSPLLIGLASGMPPKVRPKQFLSEQGWQQHLVARCFLSRSVKQVERAWEEEFFFTSSRSAAPMSSRQLSRKRSMPGACLAKS